MGERESSRAEGYYDTGESAYKERGLDTYESMVFRDSSKTTEWLQTKPGRMNPGNPSQWSLRHYHAIEHYQPINGKAAKNEAVEYDWDWPEDNVFGGIEGFFSDNAEILDLGAGFGKPVKEINETYPNVHCVGLDVRYADEKPDNTEGLVGGNFEKTPFADSAFDRILSVESFPAWMPDDDTLVEQYFSEITRVSKPGTIWRGTLPTDDILDILDTEIIAKQFASNGWELIIDKGNTAFMAKLVSKPT